MWVRIGTPVTTSYDVPFQFTGTIGRVTVALSGEEKSP